MVCSSVSFGRRLDTFFSRDKKMVGMKVHRVRGDGNCMFRALAVTFTHTFFGIDDLGDELETLAAAWLRYVAAHALWGGVRAVHAAERYQGSSLPHLLFNVARAAKCLRAPPPPLRDPTRLVGTPTPDAALVHGGVPVREAIAPTTHARYCRSMLVHGAWGGDNEIAALFVVLSLPIETFNTRGKRIYRHGRRKDAPTLRVRWNGGHYDALVDEGAEPLLKFGAG